MAISKRPTAFMKFAFGKGVAVLSTLLIVGCGGAVAQLSPVPLPDPPTSGVPLNSYKVPAESRARLGRINDLLPYATPVNRKFEGLKKVLQLPNGVLFIDADLDTDADGSPNVFSIDPDSGQRETSLSYPDLDGDDQWIDAEKVPYIVLPLKFYKQMGIHLGDVAAVVWKDRVVYAVFADEGPENLIGEGSVALSEALGFDPWEERDGRRQIVNGIDNNVLMFVFPHSANFNITPNNINQKTVNRAKPLFQALGGNVN